MKIRITTGRRVANDYPLAGVPAKQFTVNAPPIEFDPDQVFEAGNRIDTLDNDLDRLRSRFPGAEWLCDIRVGLDHAEAPSISVADTVEVISDNGDFVVGWRCMSVGWKPLTEATTSLIESN